MVDETIEKAEVDPKIMLGLVQYFNFQDARAKRIDVPHEVISPTSDSKESERQSKKLICEDDE